MANQDIGYVTCEECGFADMAVRESKTGHFYKMCDECGNQSFCRSEKCDDALLARMRPIAGGETVKPEKEKPAKPAKKEKPATETTTETKGDDDDWW